MNSGIEVNAVFGLAGACGESQEVSPVALDVGGLDDLNGESYWLLMMRRARLRPWLPCASW